jgi:Cd2+/Zn2+-exporting ATPase
MSECGSKGCGCVATPISLSEPSTNDARLTRTLYRINNMDCPTEEGLIRGKLAGMAGVRALDFNLVQRTLTVSHAGSFLEYLLMTSFLGEIRFG